MAQKILDERGIPVPTKGYIKTRVQQEIELPAPASNAPEGVIIEREGGASLDSWFDHDDQGTVFFATCTGDIKNNNITWVELYIVPQGEEWPIQPTYVLLPHYKIDTVKADPLSDDLPFLITTHSISGPVRMIAIESALVENVWNVVNEPVRRGRQAVLPAREVDLTRGQAAKMITEAVGDPQPTTRQTFAECASRPHLPHLCGGAEGPGRD